MSNNIKKLFYLKPTDDEADNLLITNVTQLQMENKCKVVISRAVFKHCTGDEFSEKKAVLISIDATTLYGLNKLEYIIEGGLRILANNDSYKPKWGNYEARLVYCDKRNNKARYDFRVDAKELNEFIIHIIYDNSIKMYILTICTQDED